MGAYPLYALKNQTKMTIKIFDYTDSTEDIFYKIIYPVYAKEFL